MVIASLGSGGAERQIVNLAILLKGKGFDVEFLIYHNDLFYKHILDSSLIKINLIESKNNFDRILKFRGFLKKTNFEAVISFLETPSFLCCLAALEGKKWKLITTELSSKNSTFMSFRGKVFGWFRRYSDHIICNSYNAMNMWNKYYPNYSEKLSVIYNPVILHTITTEYFLRENNKLNLVVAASFQYLKNPIGLIKALALMDEEMRNKIKVNWYGNKEVLKGDTKAFDEALLLIQKYSLHDVISLNDPIKNIENIMNSADIVGLFSELEGLPNAICEALMIGKPIIMSKVSDYNNLVDESNGFLCEWDNPESIKLALLKAINLSNDELLIMGKNSREKALNLFSSEKILKEWINLL